MMTSHSIAPAAVLASAPLTIDAVRLIEAQACPRRFLLSAEWRPMRWRPKTLFDACLRRAVLQLASGAAVETVTSAVRAQFLQAAANPGLDLLGDTYMAAKDWCALLDTVLTGIAQYAAPSSLLVDLPDAALSSALGWRFISYMASDGQLHRWLTVDSWREADLSRELHSWLTIGDMAIARLPMTLHIIVIGQVRKGRRASPWVRAWQHPGLAHLRLRFAKKGGAPLKGWKPVYYAGMRDRNVDPGPWVEQMWTEGVGQELLRTVPVALPSEEVCSEVLAQIMLEGARMRALIADSDACPLAALPMHRAACDGFVPCPFQSVCYTSNGGVADPATLGLYARREAASLAILAGR